MSVLVQKSSEKADVVVSDRFALPDDSVFENPAYFDQFGPCIAFSGSSYFMTYIESTDTVVRLIGKRIAADGTVLDPAGITLLSPTGIDFPSDSMTLLFDGDNYLLVWSEEQSDIVSIYGMRISESGEVLDAAGFLISETANMYGYFSAPRVVFDGDNYFAVWTDCSTGSCDIHGARFTTEAEILDDGGIVISAADAFQFQPNVGFNGTEYLVTWTDLRNYSATQEDVYAARVSLAGEVMDAGGIPVSGATRAQWYSKIASDGDDFFVVWSDSRGAQPYSAYAARVSSEGVVLDPAGIAIPYPSEVRDTLTPVFTGDHYTLYQVKNGISTLRIDTNGSLIDTQWITSITSGYYIYGSSVVFDGTNVFIVWSDARYAYISDTGNDIFGARIDENGVSLDGSGRLLTARANSQEAPVAAFGDGQYLLAWADNRGIFSLSDRIRTVYAIRISPDGESLDAESFPVNLRSTEKYVQSAVFDGTNYIVFWIEVGSVMNFVYAARITPEGEVLDPDGILLHAWEGGIFDLFSAAGDNETLTVFSRNEAPYYDVYGTRLSPDGTVIDTDPFAVSAAANNQLDPTVAYGEGQYLTAWTDSRKADYGQYGDIYAARVGSGGAVLDPDGIFVDQRVETDLYAAAAYGQGVFLVSFEAEYGKLYAARIQPSGYVIDQPPIQVTNAGFYSMANQMVFDGTNFILVWNRNDVDLPGYVYNLYGARVTSGGTVLDPDAFAVAPDAFREWELGLASDGAGRTLVVYSADDSESGDLVHRIYYRLIDTTGAPPVTTTTTTTSTTTTTTPTDDDSADDATDDSADDSDDDSSDDVSDDEADDSTDDVSDDDSDDAADDTDAASESDDDDDDDDGGCCG